MEEEKNPVADREDIASGEEEEEEKERLDFEPTEDDLVLQFLRPQLRGFAPRVPGAVLEADPCAAAPWELLARHGLLQRGHGYFFAARRRRRRRGKTLVRRTLAGGAGSWMPSGNREQGLSMTALGVVVRWTRTRYVFYAVGREEGRRSTGWVMAEYEITDARCYRRADEEEEEEDEYWVLCHIRRSYTTNGAKLPPRRRRGRGARVLGSLPRPDAEPAALGCLAGEVAGY